jgi:hypothetical protein
MTTFSHPPAGRKRRPVRRRVRWVNPLAVPPEAWETDFYFVVGPLPPRLLAPIATLVGATGSALLLVEGEVVGFRGAANAWDAMVRELARRTIPAAGGRPS